MMFMLYRSLLYVLLLSAGRLYAGESESPAAPPTEAKSTAWDFSEQTISVTSMGWRLRVMAPDLSRKMELKRPPTYAYRAMNDRFNFAFYAAPEPKLKKNSTSADCFEKYWSELKKNPIIDQKSVKLSHNDQYYRVEYVSDLPMGEKHIIQRNVNYYFVYQAKWVEVQIYMADPTPEDEQVFSKFDESFKYELIPKES